MLKGCQAIIGQRAPRALTHRGPLSGALGVQNRPKIAHTHKINSYGYRKLKFGMHVDKMQESNVLEPKRHGAPLR